MWGTTSLAVLLQFSHFFSVVVWYLVIFFHGSFYNDLLVGLVFGTFFTIPAMELCFLCVLKCLLKFHLNPLMNVLHMLHWRSAFVITWKSSLDDVACWIFFLCFYSLFLSKRRLNLFGDPVFNFSMSASSVLSLMLLLRCVIIRIVTSMSSIVWFGAEKWRDTGLTSFLVHISFICLKNRSHMLLSVWPTHCSPHLFLHFIRQLILDGVQLYSPLIIP